MISKSIVKKLLIGLIIPLILVFIVFFILQNFLIDNVGNESNKLSEIIYARLSDDITKSFKGKEASEKINKFKKEYDWLINEYSKKFKTFIANDRLILTISLVAIFIIYTLIFIYILKRLTSPIKVLCDAVEKITSGELNHRIDGVKSGDEMEFLAVKFNKMADSINEQMITIARTEREKEKIELDIRIAAEIQNSVLPQKLNYLYEKQKEYLDLFSYYKPAKTVSGDFFDYFFINNPNIFKDRDHLFFLIGDVSGKSIPGAMFMMEVKTLLKAFVEEEQISSNIDLKKMLYKASRVIYKTNKNCMFATIFCGVINIKTGEVNYVLAGHELPLIYRRQSNEVERLKVPESTMFGISDKFTEFGSGSFKLFSGDLMLLYTDGVTDARNTDGQFWGLNRLQKAVLESGNRSAEEFSDFLTSKINKFSLDNLKNDDITFIAIKLLSS